MHRWLLPLLVACGGPKDEGVEPTETTPDPTDETTTTPPTETADTAASTDGTEASCGPHATHPLLVTCTALLPEEGATELVLIGPAGNEQRYGSEEVQLEHTLLGWGLKPETEYIWRVGTQEGTVLTGALPEELIDLNIQVSGSFPSSLDAILQPADCAANYFVMLDADGDVVWFVEDDTYTNPMHGYQWNAEKNQLSISNFRKYTTLDLEGNTVDLLQRGIDFPEEHALHHDLTHWGDTTYFLFEYPVGTLNVDGVYAVRGGEIVGTWLMGDEFEVPDQGRNDWGHGNGINATEEGELILSFLNFDSVIALDGDIDGSTPFALQWVAAGRGGSLRDPDYVSVAGALEGFSGQHNASRVGDKLWVFDNDGVGNGSRALRMHMDHTAGTITHEASWDLGESCPIQSGAIPLDGGGAVVTCATRNEIAVVEEDNPVPVFSLTAACGPNPQSLGNGTTRGQPVRFR